MLGEMTMTVPKYLSGKRSYSNGDRLRQAHLDAYPEPTPWQERPAVILIALVAVMLGAGLAGWAGLAWVNSLALESLDLM